MVRRRRKSKKWISWLVFLMLLIVAGVVCYFVWDNYFREKEEVVEQENVTTQEEAEGKLEERVKKQNDDDNGAIVEEKKVVQYDGADPNKNDDLTGVITYAGASGDNLMIRINIDQYLSDGNCNLSLLNDGGVVYGDTAKIVASASTATCEGFDIPVSEVGSGNYEIVINLSSNDKIGVIKGEVNI